MKTVAELNDKHFLAAENKKPTLCKVAQYIIVMQAAVHENSKTVMLT